MGGEAEEEGHVGVVHRMNTTGREPISQEENQYHYSTDVCTYVLCEIDALVFEAPVTAVIVLMVPVVTVVLVIP